VKDELLALIVAAGALLAFLDSFQCMPSISLELLQNTAFSFASHAALQYLKVSASPMHRWARRLDDRLFL